MISEASKQRILAAVRVTEVIEDFLTLKRSGSGYLALCPFHREKTPSFRVSPERNIFKCFGCGVGGDAVTFLMRHEGFTFPEALRYLGRRYGIEVEEDLPQKKAEVGLYPVLEFAREYYQKQLLAETDAGRKARNYLGQRGFTADAVKTWSLGLTTSDTKSFVSSALKSGFSRELLKSAGLITSGGQDFFRNRLLFPLHGLSGRVIGFAGRRSGETSGVPKYLNSPGSELYLKSRFLFGLHLAKAAMRRADRCYLTEGYTDVMAMQQAGFENTVGTGGTALTVEQIALLRRFTKNVTLLFDGDVAGKKATLRSLNLLLEQDMNANVVYLPAGEDPADFVLKRDAKRMRKYLDSETKDLLLSEIDNRFAKAAGQPQQLTTVTHDLTVICAKIEDSVKRGFYLKYLAERCGLEEKLLIERVSELRRKNLQRVLKRKSDPSPTLPVTELHVCCEADFAGLLLTAGERIVDISSGQTVAMYLLADLRDEIESYFTHPVYAEVVRLTAERLGTQLPVKSDFFLHHTNAEVRRFAADRLFEPVPEDFSLIAQETLHRFKKAKLQLLARQNQERIAALDVTDTKRLRKLLKVQMRIEGMLRESESVAK